MIVGLPDVKLEYGGLRFRFDLPGAIKNDATSGDEVVVPVEGGDDVQMGGEPDGAPASGATAATSQPAPATPHFADVGPHAGSAASTAAELERLRERAATAAERKKRQATARKQRKVSEREALAVYCELPYGDTTTPTKSVKAPLWSQPRCDLKQGFIKLVGEITHRCATEAARTGLSTKAYYTPRVLRNPHTRTRRARRGSKILVAMRPALSTAIMALWAIPGMVAFAPAKSPITPFRIVSAPRMCAPVAQFSAALLFDCDGVLVETEELHRIAYKCVPRGPFARTSWGT